MGTDRRSRLAVIIVGLLLAILTPVAYLLSIGPYYWLVSNEYLPGGSDIVYEPLDWLSDASPIFRRLLRWYLSFW